MQYGIDAGKKAGKFNGRAVRFGPVDGRPGETVSERFLRQLPLGWK